MANHSAESLSTTNSFAGTGDWVARTKTWDSSYLEAHTSLLRPPVKSCLQTCLFLADYCERK